MYLLKIQVNKLTYEVISGLQLVFEDIVNIVSYITQLYRNYKLTIIAVFLDTIKHYEEQ